MKCLRILPIISILSFVLSMTADAGTDPSQRGSEDRCGLRAHGLLEDPQKFIIEETDHGILYHAHGDDFHYSGEDDFDSIPALIEQKRLQFGLLYSTKYITYSANGYGIPIPFRLKDWKGVRILKQDDHLSEEQKKILDHLVKQALEAGYKYPTERIRYSVLYQYCDLDIHLDNWPFIVNLDAFHFPKSVDELIKGYSENMNRYKKLNLQNPHLNSYVVRRILSEILLYPKIFEEGKKKGMSGLTEPLEIKPILEALLRNPNPKLRGHAVANYLELYSKDNSDFKLPTSLKQYNEEKTEEFFSTLVNGIPYKEIGNNVVDYPINSILKFIKAKNERLQSLIPLLDQEDYGTIKTICHILKESLNSYTVPQAYHGTQQNATLITTLIEKMFALLKRKDPKVIQEATNFLYDLKSNLHVESKTILEKVPHLDSEAAEAIAQQIKSACSSENNTEFCVFLLNLVSQNGQNRETIVNSLKVQTSLQTKEKIHKALNCSENETTGAPSEEQIIKLIDLLKTMNSGNS